MVDYGRYQLTAPIGRGRVAEAFKAKSFGVEGFEKALVIKRILPEVAEDPARLTAVLHAARRSMRLSHANVAQVFDMGDVVDGAKTSHYLATEYVPGVTLSAVLERCRISGTGLPARVALFVATEVAKGLDHAHRCRDEGGLPHGVVHGALTPNNILLSWDGEVKLSDFGLVLAAESSGASAADDLRSLGQLLLDILEAPRSVQDESAPPSEREVTGEAVRALLAAIPPLSLSAAGFYEALMEHAYAIRAPLNADALAEFVEKSRTTPLTNPPTLFEGALAYVGESLPPRISAAGSTPLPPALSASAPFVGQGVAALSLRLGNGSGLEVVRELAEEWLARHGATVVTHSSRELEAYFLQGQDPVLATTLAARTALEILTRGAKLDPTLSAGLDLGEVNLNADASIVDDEKRRLVFASTRSLSSSSSGRLGVSAGVATYLQTWFELETLEPDAGVWLVGQLRPLHSATRFVGRKSELGELGNRLVQAVRGTPSAVGVVGEGGIGKSRLLREMRRRLKKGTVNVGFYMVNCRANSSTVPYSAVGDMLRKLCGVRENDVGDWTSVVQPRLRTLGLGEDEIQSVLIALGARSLATAQFNPAFLEGGMAKMMHSLSLERPHLFAFDRAEHLDVQSADLLGSVVARLKHSRTLLVFAGRAGSVGFLREIPGYSEFSLGTLLSEDITRLVQFGTGVANVPDELVEFVIEQSAGHPMVAIELLREGIERGAIQTLDEHSVKFSVPFDAEVRSLREFLEARLLALSEAERAVLTAVVVLDEPVALAAISTVSELSLAEVASVVDDLEVRGMLQRLSPGTVAIAVQVLAEVVAVATERAHWQKLHERAARYYQGLLGGLGFEAGARVAQHLDAAGKRDEARLAYGEHGLNLVHCGLLEQAAWHLSRALGLTASDGEDIERVASWVSALLLCVSRSSFPELAPALVASAELLLQQNTTDPSRLKAALDAAEALSELHRFREAESVLGVVVARADGLPGLVRRALTLEATLAAQLGQFPRAVRALERTAEFGQGSTSDQHRVLVTLAQALAGAGEHSRALATLAEAEALAPKVGTLEACQRARSRAFLLACQGDDAAAAVAAARAVGLAESAGILSELAQSLHDEGVALLLANDLPKCFATCSRAALVASQTGSERLINASRLLLAYLDGQRDGVEAERQLRQGVEVATDEGWPGDAVLARYLLGRMLLESDQPSRGRDELSLALQAADALGNQRWARLCRLAATST
ncbi:MAG: AAA family ATPase [Polyangiaceae bacterium]|nr:AAA family ATPase [Polyangiaceae bacterium]